MQHFDEPLPDGVSFRNSETGEVHVCGDACEERIEVGERVVCRLTRAVLCETQMHSRPFSSKKRRVEAPTNGGREDERGSCRRTGDVLMCRIFNGALPNPESFVDRALKVHEWLGERFPFDCVLFACLICVAGGVNTDHVYAQRDETVARLLPPTRVVSTFGIKQNGVTKAYTAIMRKKSSGQRLIM